MGLKFFMKSSLALDIKLFFVILLLISRILVHMQVKKHPSSDILRFTLILHSSHCSCTSAYITSANTKLYPFSCPISFSPSSKPRLAEPKGICVRYKFWQTPRPAFFHLNSFIHINIKYFIFIVVLFFMYSSVS